MQNNNVTYFDSFGVEHIPKEIKAFINNKNIKANIFRIQAYDSIMCGYFCIGFIDFMLKQCKFLYCISIKYKELHIQYTKICILNIQIFFHQNDDIIYFMSNI